MNKKKLDKMVGDYLEKGGTIKKIKVGESGLTDKDESIIDINVPDSFIIPDKIIKEDIKHVL